MLNKIIADRIFSRESYRWNYQNKFFKIRYSEPSEFEIDFYQPIYELENFDSRMIAIFRSQVEDTVDFHFVFKDEYIRWSKRVDERYRQLRKKHYGTTLDVESIRILPKVKTVIYPLNNGALSIYDLPSHLKVTERFITPTIFSNTWNHMMSNRWTFHCLRLGGYEKIEDAEIFTGTRDDAVEYAKSLDP